MQTAPSLQPVSRSEEVQKRDKEVSKEVTLRYFHDHDSTTTKKYQKTNQSSKSSSTTRAGIGGSALPERSVAHPGWSAAGFSETVRTIPK